MASRCGAGTREPRSLFRQVFSTLCYPIPPLILLLQTILLLCLFLRLSLLLLQHSFSSNLLPRSSLFPVVSCYLFTGLRLDRDALLTDPAIHPRYSNTASSLKAQREGGKKKKKIPMELFFQTGYGDDDFFLWITRILKK